MCFGNLNLLVTQQQLNKVIPIMWRLITMAVIESPQAALSSKRDV